MLDICVPLGGRRWGWFPSYAVDGYDGEAVGDGVAAHDGLPGAPLALLLVGSVLGGIADGSGVDEQVGTLKSHEAGCLGVPLVPADEHAQPAYARLYGVEAEVAGGEVELLVVARVVGYVHLAVAAGYGAVALDDHGGVVVESGGAALEERGDDDHLITLGQFAVDIGRRAGNGLGEVEVVDVLHLTEVERVVQLLQYDELCATTGEVGDAVGQALDVVFDVSGVVLL